eukprot:CAMPEP_0118691140 /NCGR_PEP_ID=MMETSP0800-20121206/10512_1 /TAXON_ID=210618 ORGANISM="Striatella unipunctata, Strain CCMP2910" /NCGR_SAMPLE_ID=MMETSP0800 /ASSEMBLY_ACC=CAM_ASM_000638 /LENGTH=354 /DNA_ID=CAMNT_0006588881 /DNA_START=1 /DNA_END=1065 /DNA_ORIENTATION=+
MNARLEEAKKHDRGREAMLSSLVTTQELLRLQHEQESIRQLPLLPLLQRLQMKSMANTISPTLLRSLLLEHEKSQSKSNFPFNQAADQKLSSNSIAAMRMKSPEETNELAQAQKDQENKELLAQLTNRYCSSREMKDHAQQDPPPTLKTDKGRDRNEDVGSGDTAGNSDEVDNDLQLQTAPLGKEGDDFWLSSFLCFVRAELVEVIVVQSATTVNPHTLDQVGFRCKFCANIQNPRLRIKRASSFPSSISRIYQSLTMMLRDHFPKCQEIPEKLKQRFDHLRSTAIAGAADSKNYWVTSAKDIGLIDTERGISIDKEKWRAHCLKSQAILAPAPSATKACHQSDVKSNSHVNKP